MQETTYLKNIFDSIEYLFVNNNVAYISDKENLSYLDAYNKVGLSMYKEAWINREFFARQGCTSYEEFKCSRKLFYHLFHSPEEEMDAAYRNSAVEYQLLTALQSESVKAYYLNHHSGESSVISKEYWRGHNCDYSRVKGRYKKDRLRPKRDLPGEDYIIYISRVDCSKIIKGLPKKTKKTKTVPSKADYNSAVSELLEKCKSHNRILNRDIFYKYLNTILETDFFKDSSYNRKRWNEDWPSSFKQARGKKNAQYLEEYHIK